MQEIKGSDAVISVLLSGGSYTIDYYQREYRWGRKQIEELVNDLVLRFLDSYQSGHQPSDVAGYGHYFLGSIVVSKAGERRSIVDGQQRLTSLTLLLIALHNLQKEVPKKVGIESLIFSDDYGTRRFRLDIEERTACMEGLLNEGTFNPEGASESVQNLVGRYGDILDILPADLRAPDVLPLFIYWVTNKVILVQIVAYDDTDAYTIFETMNDRGLSLTPTDMLKGYLLANIADAPIRLQADKEIKDLLAKLRARGKDVEADFFKAWLRSRYAESIRERREGAKPLDWDLIGTEYHRWVRANEVRLGLLTSADFRRFATEEMRFYVILYLRLLDAAESRTPGLEAVRYNADAGFTLQLQILLAAANPSDTVEDALAKIGVVADFIDCWLNVRLWNYRTTSYSAMQYAAFLVTRDVRGKNLDEIKRDLRTRLVEAMKEDGGFKAPVQLNQFTAKAIQRQIARMIDWLETRSGVPGRYEDYIVRSGKNAYEIEHIWANRPERFAGVFDSAEAFQRHRNMIGGLLLLPKSINASLSDLPYEQKLPKYASMNPLAQTLHEGFYMNNPRFKQAVADAELPFMAYGHFGKAEIEERSELLRRFASVIWSPDRLGSEAVVLEGGEVVASSI